MVVHLANEKDFIKGKCHPGASVNGRDIPHRDFLETETVCGALQDYCCYYH